MKKMLFMAMLFIASMSLTSCGNSPERLVCQYEKACQAGNAEKADKILKKMEKLGEDKFSSTQEERVLKAYDELVDL